MGVFSEEAGEIFQVSEPARDGRLTPHPLANRLLHWFSTRFHYSQSSHCHPGGQLAIFSWG